MRNGSGLEGGRRICIYLGWQFVGEVPRARVDPSSWSVRELSSSSTPIPALKAGMLGLSRVLHKEKFSVENFASLETVFSYG